MSKTFIIGEIGINHNGDVEVAKRLISEAKKCGCDAVKFQKRTLDLVYSKEELDTPRESPWGNTNRQQKSGLEFNKEDYDELDEFCRENSIVWFASAWDVESQLFLRQYDLKYNKVASAMLTDRKFVEMVAEEKKYTFISTGMSNVHQVEKAVEIFVQKKCPYEILHCCSEYPMPIENANLNFIKTLQQKFGCKIGYSGHETGIVVSIAAVALGATTIERHITLDRSMYGSDQSASLEIGGLRKMVDYIRAIEKALGTGVKLFTDKEREIEKKLRKANTL